MLNLHQHVVDAHSGPGGLVVEQLEDDHSQAPQVRLVTLHFPPQRFGAHVIQSSSLLLQHFLVLVGARPPEVANLDPVVLIHQNVLELKVSENVFLLVDKEQGVDQLANYLPDENFLQDQLFLEQVQQVPLRAPLQDDVQLVILFKKIVELDDVFVVEISLDAQFVFN